MGVSGRGGGGQSDLTYMLEFLGWCVALPYTYGT